MHMYVYCILCMFNGNLITKPQPKREETKKFNVISF